MLKSRIQLSYKAFSFEICFESILEKTLIHFLPIIAKLEELALTSLGVGWLVGW